MTQVCEELTPGLTSVVLCESGVGHRQFRIPGFTVSTRGTLVVAVDARPDLDDLPAPVDLVVLRSTDGGATWTPPALLRGGTGHLGHGDVSLLTDHATGRLFAFHASSDRAGFFESGTGVDDADPTLLHCDLAVSDDDGRTWRTRRLSRTLRSSLATRLPAGAALSGLFAASGSGVQVTDGPYAGRLLQGFVLLLGREVHAAVARSDDHGETWTMGAPVGPGANENAVVALPDGRVGLQCRAPGARLMAWSEDGGDTFGPLEPVTSLPDPGNNGSLVRLDGSPTLLACTHTADPHLRRALTVSVSADGGTRFTPAVCLTDGGAGYSVAQPLPGAAPGATPDLGVVWEDAGYRRLLFTRVPAAILRDVGHAHDRAYEHDRAQEHARSHDRAAGAEHGLEPGLVLDHVLARRPEAWPDDETSVVIALDTEGWDPAVFKIVDVTAGRQVVRTRAAYRTALGEPTPGLHEGDTLTLTARLPITLPLREIRVDGRPAEASSVAAITDTDTDTEGSGWAVLRGLRRVVAATDLAAPEVTVTVTAVGADDRTASVSLGVPIRPGADER
jgi:sialidase-1